MAKRRRARPPADDDRIKFPLGETVSGSSPWNESSWDESSDGASSDGRLPGLPPGSTLEDDANLDGFEGLSASSGPFDASDDGDALEAGDPLGDDAGPAGGLPSGPLIIVDDGLDDVDASSRYQASIVDDSARLAGAASQRKRGARKEQPRDRSARRSWRAEAYDPDDDVPTLSRRVSPQAGPARRGPLVAVAAVAAVALGVVATGLELRRRADLDALNQAHRQALADQAKTHEDLLAAEAERARQARAEGEAALARERDRAREELAEAVERTRTEGEQALADAAQAARAAGRSEGRAQGRREAEAAFEVELASAKDPQEVERAVEAAVEPERAARAEAEQAAAAARERADALEAERADLEQRLAEAERARAARDSEPEAAGSSDDGGGGYDDGGGGYDDGGGGYDDGGGEAASASGGGGGTDFDAMFDDAFSDEPSRPEPRSRTEPKPSAGGDGTDFGAMFDDAFSGEPTPEEGDGSEPFAFGEEDGGEARFVHPVEAVWGWLRGHIHGKAGYRNFSHFSTGPNHDSRQTRHELRVELEYREWLARSESGAYGLRTVLGADVRVDDADMAAGVMEGVDDETRRRPIAVPKEAYLALTLDWLEVKGGWQIFSWGTGDLFNPTNTINPIDFEDLFDARQIPVLAAAAKADFGKFSLEAVAVPTFTRSRLPLREGRWDLLQRSPLTVYEPDDPEFAADNVQLAARAVLRLGGWDIGLCGYTGYNDFPAPRLILEPGTGNLAIDPVFERQHMLGADFATTLGFLGIAGPVGDVLSGIQLHGEVSHTWTADSEADDYVQYVVGLNYTFVDVIGEHDILLALEYAGDQQTRARSGPLADVVQLDRIFKGAVMGRVEYKIEQPLLDLSLTVAGAVITYGDPNGYLRPMATWRVTEYLQIDLGGDVFLGPEDTFFGQFRNDGRVIGEVRLVF